MRRWARVMRNRGEGGLYVRLGGVVLYSRANRHGITLVWRRVVLDA